MTKTKLEEFREANGRSSFEASRLLFKWLSDDAERADLYGSLLKDGEPLKFQSRADSKLPPTKPGESEFHQDVYLLTKRDHIKEALTNAGDFSNSPYQMLGSGTFMLGLDPGNPDHAKQRKFAQAFLKVDAHELEALSSVAFKAAAVLPLKLRKFDVSDLAEQAALRFVGFLFGFAQGDHPLIEATMRQAYRGLNYQIIGRHFVSEPATIPEASAGMGALLKRTAYLIDLYRAQAGRDQEDEYKVLADELRELQQLEDGKHEKPLEKFKPILKRIAEQEFATDYSGAELAVIVVGLIAGTVGNVQACTAIAINEFFRENGVLAIAKEAALKSWQADADYGATGELKALIWEALRLNPPAAFLPRRTRQPVLLGTTTIPADRIVLLAMGAATRDHGADPDVFKPDRKFEDPYIFGDVDRGGGLHQCVGKYVALPLATHIIRQVMRLPGLAETFDPRDGRRLRLEKTWGIICQRYPMEFARDQILTQSPLIVIMNVRSPVPEHAEALRKVIRYGAPRIEKRLRDSKHVHFAQFLFIENDSKLVLFTVYDRDFDSYIEHFALKIGPLFDRIFEHIQNPPPTPVDEFPKEFVDAIRRHNARPAGDYFFSAYPNADVSMISHQFPRESA